MRISLEQIRALPPDQQAQAREWLEQYEAALKANPLLGYVPHSKQVTFHESRDQLKAFLGGNRSGKTTAGILDDIIQAVDKDCLPAPLAAYKKWEPPFYGRIIVPDFTSTLEGVIFQKFREWCPKAQLAGGSFGKAYDKTRRKLHFENGSWFDFLTFEQDLDKFGGAALHRVHYDEEPPSNIRRESTMRLIDYGGDELFTMTPLHGMSWMFDDIWEPYTKGLLTDSTVVLVDMDDNPHLDEKTKQRALAGLTREEREARKSGRFVHFAGMIYDEFSRNTHVIPEVDRVPDGAKVYVGIDPGSRHMAAVVFCYLTSENTMVVFDELALQGHNVKQVCEAIKLKLTRWGKTSDTGQTTPLLPAWFVIDPSARNVLHQTGRSDQMEYTTNGIVTILGQNSVTAGISKVKERLQSHRLLVTGNCQEIISEFRKYRWASETRTEDDAKERPVKRDDHCFPAGTLVDTGRGRRPIESIEPGDLIWTRQGLFPALLAGQTQQDAPTLSIELDDGTELVGTGNHPVWVDGKGWTPLDSIRYGDILCTWEGEKRSGGTGSSSTATLNPITRAHETTSPPPRCDCIKPSGNKQTVPFRMGITSTISTVTRGTTPSLILSVSPEGTIRGNIGRRSDESGNASVWLRLCGRRPWHGMEHQTDSHGTANMPNEHLRSVSPPASAVISVGKTSRASSLMRDFAPMRVSRRTGGTVASMMCFGPARTAGVSSRSTGTLRPRLVRRGVVKLSASGSRTVYNLTVLGPSEYFANGVLVHNCLDALRYVVMSMPSPPEVYEEERPMSPMERAAQNEITGRSYKQKGPASWLFA